MARKEIIKPEPQPKVGDKVKYVQGEHKHELLPAEVLKVHEGHDGRLVNLSVPGEKIVENVAWDEVGEDLPLHGNSWHWPKK